MDRLLGIRWVCIACVILQTLIFGSGSAITKIAYESVSPLWCLVLRFGIASLVFLLLFGPRIVRGLRQARLSDWLPAALGMAVSYIAANVALDLTTATNVGFLVALPVVFTPFIALFVLKRRYQMAHLPFQVAVVVGLFFLCSNGGAFSFGMGEAFALLGSVGIAAALVFGEKGLARLDVVTVSATQVFVTFILSLAGALAFEPPLDAAAVRPEAWAVIAFLALASTCVTFALQNVALTRLPSFTVSMLLTGEPIFTAFFSWLVLGETLSMLGLVGAGIIIVCVVAETYIDGRSASVSAAARCPDAQLAASGRTCEAAASPVSTPLSSASPQRRACDLS